MANDLDKDDMSKVQKAITLYRASRSRASSAKPSPASPFVDEQPYKRARHDTSTANSDSVWQPFGCNTDPSTDIVALAREASLRTSSKFDLSRFEPIEPVNNVAQPRLQPDEVICISGNSDDGADSEDEPLAAVRKRKHNDTAVSSSGHQGEKQPRDKEPSAQPSSAHKTTIATKTSNRYYTEPLPSAGNKRPRMSHVSETDSETSTNVRNNKDGQSSANPKSFTRAFLVDPDWATTRLGNPGSQSRGPDLQQPEKPQEPHQNDKDVSGIMNDSHPDEEKQELQSKLRQQAREIKVLTQQLNSSRDIARKEMQSKQAKEDEIMALKKEIKELDQEVRHHLLTQLNLVKDSREPSNNASEQMAVENAVTVSPQERVTELGKAVDDKTTESKRFEGTIDDLRRQLESEKKEAAQKLFQVQKRAEEHATGYKSQNVSLNKSVGKLKISLNQERTKFRELLESKDKDGKENIAKSQALRKQMKEQTDELQSQIKELKRQLDESVEKSRADNATTKRVEELEEQIRSQLSEIQDYEKRVVGLSKELDWNEDVRERFKQAWRERDLEERRWKSDLRAVLSNDLASLSDKSKAAIEPLDLNKRAAPGFIERAAPEVIERAAPEVVERAAQADGSQSTSAVLGGLSTNGGNMASD